jgi:hypothetical protein
MLGLHHLWFSRAETSALSALAAERGLATDRVERLFAREPAGRPIFLDDPDPGASSHLSGDDKREDL